MENQNQASTITPQEKADVQAKLAEISGKLAFLRSLKGSDIEAMVEDANSYIAAYPALLSRLSSRGQVHLDSKLSHELETLVARINQLAESVQNILTAVDAETMARALEQYEAAHKEPQTGRKGLSGEWIAGATVAGGSPSK
jgi:hypothetical protein